MSFVVDPYQGQPVDTLSVGTVLDDTRVTTEQQDAAWALIQKRCDDADMIGRMLGVVAS